MPAKNRPKIQSKNFFRAKTNKEFKIGIAIAAQLLKNVIVSNDCGLRKVIFWPSKI